MPKKKIIILSNGYRGGANEFLNQHLSFLSKKKQKIILIDDNPRKNFESITNKTKVFRVNVNNPNFTSKRKLDHILNDNGKGNILFITNFVFFIKFFFILNRFRQNNIIVLTLHSGILKPNLKNFILGFLFSFLYVMPTKIYFGSNSSKKWWLNTFPWMKIKNKQIIYNGVKLTRNKIKKINKRKINISFIGRLEKENNPDFFIEIANNYKNNNLKINFNIFGEGPMFSKLKKMKLNKNIYFHGWCDKKKIYSLTDIVIITSTINNFPYVALESISNGIPIVSTSKGDIRHIIKNSKNGFIKQTKSSAEVIKLIDKVINNYKKFSMNALRHVKKFDETNSLKLFWKKIL